MTTHAQLDLANTSSFIVGVVRCAANPPPVSSVAPPGVIAVAPPCAIVLG
ncbi:hypothetical protein [Halotalea alkalilenta]|nr:hypothetical protein [Halotalea alkalilenta]